MIHRPIDLPLVLEKYQDQLTAEYLVANRPTPQTSGKEMSH
jgi:hypothetical protein